MSGEAVDVLHAHQRHRLASEERAWRAAEAHARVLAAVEKRLIAAGAVTELRQFYGLSAQEQDRLVWLERNDETEAA